MEIEDPLTMKKYKHFKKNRKLINILNKKSLCEINSLFLESHGVSEEDSKKIMQEKNGLSNNECITQCGNLRKVACVPCGHRVMCGECYEKKITLTQCPLCSQAVANMIEIK